MTATPLSALSEPDDEDDDDDVDVPYCGACWEEFHDDDTGGYNPACECGARCRSCCPSDCLRDADSDDDYDGDGTDDERNEDPA